MNLPRVILPRVIPVHVSKSDIRKASEDRNQPGGNGSVCSTCPVARAATRAFRRAGHPGTVTTGGSKLNVRTRGRDSRVTAVYNLPRRARIVAWQFDSGNTPTPITFRAIFESAR